jgi:hypothetical protein
MTRLVRRAGRGRLSDGSVVIWSIADGTRGRRWREVRRHRDGDVASSLLLETFPDGRFAHTELSTAAGLLTLHPEADTTLHGNAITGTGIRHVRGIAWPDGSVLLVEGSPIAAAAAARFRATRAPDAGRLLEVTLDLELRAIDAPLRGPAAGIDGDGLPMLDDSESWPLED